MVVLISPASRNQSPFKPGKRPSQVNLAVIPCSVTQFPETTKPLSDQQPNPSQCLPSHNAKYVFLTSSCAEFNKAVSTFTSLFTLSTPARKDRIKKKMLATDAGQIRGGVSVIHGRNIERETLGIKSF
ncbi:uncharacterized [Tachysurus ichikawai]